MVKINFVKQQSPFSNVFTTIVNLFSSLPLSPATAATSQKNICNQPSPNINNIMTKCFQKDRRLFSFLSPSHSQSVPALQVKGHSFVNHISVKSTTGQSSICSGWGGREWKGGYCISIYVAFRVRVQRWKVTSVQRLQGEIPSKLLSRVCSYMWLGVWC